MLGGRTIVHLAPLLAVGKIAASLAAFAKKTHVSYVISKAVQTYGIKGTLQKLRELNDTLLAKGVHSEKVHDSVAASMARLEARLDEVGQSEYLAEIKQWLSALEAQAPELLVTIGKAYVSSLPQAKVAKSILSAFEGVPPREVPEDIDGVSAEEWQRRVHAAFPKLKGHRVILKRQKEAS